MFHQNYSGKYYLSKKSSLTSLPTSVWYLPRKQARLWGSQNYLLHLIPMLSSRAATLTPSALTYNWCWKSLLWGHQKKPVFGTLMKEKEQKCYAFNPVWTDKVSAKVAIKFCVEWIQIKIYSYGNIVTFCDNLC